MQRGGLSGDHITSIARKCPNLRKLEITKARIITWPTVCMPRLKELIMLSPHCGSEMFKNVELHLVLPHLETMHVFLHPGGQMWLPDLTRNLKLREVRLDGGGTYQVQIYQEGTVPFPLHLKKLSCWAQSFGLTKQQIRNYYKNSDCKLDI